MLNDTILYVEYELIKYVYSVWLILGIPGGILNLLVFSRPQMLKNSCCVYFLATSLNNIISLGIGVGPVLYSLNHPDPLVTSVVFCKVRGYFLQISLMVSRWFISFACIDRVALSSSNQSIRGFAKVPIACRSIIGIIVFWFIIATHRLIFYEVKGNLCAIINNPSAALYHTIYILLGGGVLPTTIMTVCAILIRRNLYIKRHRKFQKATIQFLVDQQRHKESMDAQVVTILYIQIICYVILMTPQMCNVTYNAIVTRIPNRGPNVIVIDQFIAFLAELMMYVFPVLSFYLYTLSSPTFRLDLWHILVAVPTNHFRPISRQVQPYVPPHEHGTIIQHQDITANKHQSDHEKHLPSISGTLNL